MLDNVVNLQAFNFKSFKKFFPVVFVGKMYIPVLNDIDLILKCFIFEWGSVNFITKTGTRGIVIFINFVKVKIIFMQNPLDSNPS